MSDMSVRFLIKTTGIEEAKDYLTSLHPRIENEIGAGLVDAGNIIRDAINSKVEETGAGKVDVYPLSKFEVVVGIGIEELKKIKEIPKWRFYRGIKRCIWWGYRTYVEKEKREPIPAAGLNREQTLNVVRTMLPMIKGMMIASVRNIVRR